MHPFSVIARTANHCVQYSAIAVSSVDAALVAVDLFDDEPCSVTVTPLQVAR